MKMLTCRVEDEVVASIDAAAVAAGMDRSGYLRTLLVTPASAPVQPPPPSPSAPRSITPADLLRAVIKAGPERLARQDKALVDAAHAVLSAARLRIVDGSKGKWRR